MAPPPRSIRLLLAAAAHLHAPASAEAGFCCLAAADLGDVCGSCFPAAVARADSECGPSEAACADCGSSTTWCREGGGDAPAPAREARQVDSTQSAPAVVDAPASEDGNKAVDAGGGAAAHAKEIVILLTEAPVGLKEGTEVAIELGSAPGSGAAPEPARSESGWISPFLVCEGIGAACALVLAAFYRSEARRKAAALEAVKAFGKASPGAASPGTMERGKSSRNKMGGGKGSRQSGAFASPAAARAPASPAPQSPAQSQMSSFLSFAGFGRQV